ncbi:MAG: GAF domain-containing sensor histidine kinase [Anaeromyxobacter sp.]
MHSEAERLRILRDYGILDTVPEESFDGVVRLASRFFSVPIVLVSLVEESRQWFKARVGLAAAETPREWSFCAHAIAADAPLVVADARQDPRFAANPLVTGDPWIRFYCGVPIRSPEGAGLGTLCLIDRAPRQLPEDALGALLTLGRLVESELELRRGQRRLQGGLEEARSHQRDQELLAAMVVHDLRGPLTAIELAASVIEPADAGSRELLLDVTAASTRMRHLLADLLDLTLSRSRELPLRIEPVDLAGVANGAGARLARLAGQRGQVIACTAPEGPAVVMADRQLLDRVLENLIGNAMKHGPSGQPIEISVEPSSAGGAFCAVRDHGRTIEPGQRERIFEAFERGPAGAPSEGHGLGLAFCQLVVRALGGAIEVVPAPGGGNVFRFELPHDRAGLRRGPSH